MTAEPIRLHAHPRSRYPREHRAQGKAAVLAYGGVKPARRALEALWGADPSAPDEAPSTSTLRAWRDDPTIEPDREWVERIQREFAIAQSGMIRASPRARDRAPRARNRVRLRTGCALRGRDVEDGGRPTGAEEPARTRGPAATAKVMQRRAFHGGTG